MGVTWKFAVRYPRLPSRSWRKASTRGLICREVVQSSMTLPEVYIGEQFTWYGKQAARRRDPRKAYKQYFRVPVYMRKSWAARQQSLHRIVRGTEGRKHCWGCKLPCRAKGRRTDRIQSASEWCPHYFHISIIHMRSRHVFRHECNCVFFFFYNPSSPHLEDRMFYCTGFQL